MPGPTTTLTGADTTRLHLGCGRSILPGWVNVDAVAGPDVDVVHDLDACADRPLPFDDDSVDELLGSHLLEHLHHPLPFMQELHRVARAGATAWFHVPYGSSDDAFEDPTHVRQYFVNSWIYFGQPAYWRADYGYRGDWRIVCIELAVARDRYEGVEPQAIFEDVMRARNVVIEMRAQLTAVKPIREPRQELQEPRDLRFVLT
jgi:SAM-dependent methyltransferase